MKIDQAKAMKCPRYRLSREQKNSAPDCLTNGHFRTMAEVETSINPLHAFAGLMHFVKTPSVLRSVLRAHLLSACDLHSRTHTKPAQAGRLELM
ncbi:MAG: hypothetical protein M0P63_00215 [Azoarcus sp.]|nr:hypothetical protein [Azoarcus sp.]